MRAVGLGLLASMFALSGFGFAEAEGVAAPPARVAFTRLVIRLKAGDPFFVLSPHTFCFPSETKTWPGGQTEVKIAPYLDDFRSQFSDAGLNPEGEASLFDTSGASSAEYALAGAVVEEHLDICSPNWTIEPNPERLKISGDASVTIDWQLYSRLENKIVATARTSASFSSREKIYGGLDAYNRRLMNESFRQVAANAEVRRALTGTGLTTGDMVNPPELARLMVPGTLGVEVQTIDRASQAVVVIYAGDAMGSGVLISREGYLLTDAHVVGDASQVRVRWSDGKEGVATVVRTSKQRDVAVLRTDAAGRAPLPIRSEPVRIGETVFAIGSPEDQAFQGTVTKGVVSATRVFAGYTYIQSDVTAGHGSSGGPLLDESGRILGLTDKGTHNATSSGISLFTPIKDAIDFLGLDLR